MQQNRPKISIISPSKNTGRFAKETIESILAQTFKNWEHIVVDGVSTDETLDILKQYPHIRWISEKDSGPDEAFKKGLAMAQGEYIMMCCISDGYLDKNWFKKCVETLDSRREISLVWGIDQNMLEDGTLDTIVYNSWLENPPPSGKDYLYYWLKNGTLFHERDLCVRKKVMDICFPPLDLQSIGQECGHLKFGFNFNRLGFLPQFISAVAAYGRLHSNNAGQKQAITGEAEKRLKEYFHDIEEYKKKLIKGDLTHCYRDGDDKLLPGTFDLRKYLQLDKRNKFKEIVELFIPPIFFRLTNKISAKYRSYQNLKKLKMSVSADL